MAADNELGKLDTKPDIKAYLNDLHIGTFSVQRIRLKKPGLISGKMIFTSTRYFALIDKILMTDNIELMNSVEIKTDTGRICTLDKFLKSLEYCDEIL